MATTNGNVQNGSLQQQREEIFDAVEGQFGFVPNLITELAESPAVAKAYLTATDILSSGSLSPKEQQAVQIAVATHNACHYCTAVHGGIGLKAGLSEDDIAAILSGEVPEDERLAALVAATRRVLDARGWLDANDVGALNARGVSKAELYEIIAFVGVKTITNYINHIAQTEIDEPFRALTDLPAYQQAIGAEAQ